MGGGVGLATGGVAGGGVGGNEEGLGVGGIDEDAGGSDEGNEAGGEFGPGVAPVRGLVDDAFGDEALVGVGLGVRGWGGAGAVVEDLRIAGLKDSGAGRVGVHPGLDELAETLASIQGFEDAAGHAVGGGEGAVGAAVHEQDAVGI